MHGLAGLHMLSLCVFYDLFDIDPDHVGGQNLSLEVVDGEQPDANPLKLKP